MFLIVNVMFTLNVSCRSAVFICWRQQQQVDISILSNVSVSISVLFDFNVALFVKSCYLIGYSSSYVTLCVRSKYGFLCLDAF